MSAVSCIVYMSIIFYDKHCVVMADTKKKENLHEWSLALMHGSGGGTEKKDSERGFCDIKDRKKNLDNKRIVAYKLNNEEEAS